MAPATSAGESPFDGEFGRFLYCSASELALRGMITSSVTTLSVVAGDFHSGVILAALSDFRTCPLCSYCILRVISVVFRLAFPNRFVLLGGLFQCDLRVYISEVFEAYLGYVLRCLG